MPVMDGLEFTERVKQDVTTSHIPVILLTAKTDENDIQKAICGERTPIHQTFQRQEPGVAGTEYSKEPETEYRALQTGGGTEHQANHQQSTG